MSAGKAEVLINKLILLDYLDEFRRQEVSGVETTTQMTTRQLDHFYEQIKIIQKVSVQTKWFPGSKFLTFLISLKFLSHTRSFIIILPLILNLSPLNLSLQIV